MLVTLTGKLSSLRCCHSAPASHRTWGFFRRHDTTAKRPSQTTATRYTARLTGQREPMHQPDISPLRVFIEPVKITQTGQGYAVSFNGETIITRTRNPAADACRHLVALGHRGRMEMWDKERSYPRAVFPDIERAARLTVAENERHGPRIVRFERMAEDLRGEFVASRRPA